MGDDMMDDYRPMPHLDNYDPEALDDDIEDDREEDEVFADMRAAEASMDRRDDAAGVFRRNVLPGVLQERDGSEDGDVPIRPRRRRRIDSEFPQASNGASQDQAMDQEQVSEEEDDEDVDYEDFYKVKGPLREWVISDGVQRFLASKFRHFLKTFKNPQTGQEEEYLHRIQRMMENGSCSLEMDYNHLLHVHTIMAVWLADAPAPMIELMDSVAYSLVVKLYPNYPEMEDAVHVRIANLPIVDQIRNIRQTHLNTLIKVGGVVTRRTGVFPQLQQVKYDCTKCGAVLGPFFQNGSNDIKINACVECQSKGPFTVNIEQTIYRNYQKLSLQESPGTVPAGRLPRYKEVILLNDLIDCARPGEEIEVTGIYVNNFDAALNTSHGFPVFSTSIEANQVSKKQDLFAAYKLTDEDKEEILKLSKHPRIANRIIKSIAPSIYGHEDIKTAIALAMFGGQEKHVSGKLRLRGDINVLLLGDPGTAKSQFMKYIEATAARAVYTTGRGASAVGLTAAVHKDPITREWTLEGGALVLADRGICLIDEFDKMSDQDRVSIHEAMEQQSISISKAGIVTSLHARCSVIAAANPVGGRYDSTKPFSQNVELTDPILSRFDILLVIKDVVDPVVDEMLAKFVVDSHNKSHPRFQHMEEDLRGNSVFGRDDPEIIPQDMLRKYITYAKGIRPKLHGANLDKIALVYGDLRRESLHGQGVSIAVRHIESMIRCSEAHARLHLRDTVNEDDVSTAVRVMLTSFVATQKYAVQKSMHKTFKKYMIYKKDFNELLLHILRNLVKEAILYEECLGTSRSPLSHIDIQIDAFEAKAREYDILDLQPFFESSDFIDNNFELREAENIIRHPLL